MRNTLIIAFLVIFTFAMSFPQIKRGELINTVKYLASPELQGRMSGHSGYDKAVKYICEHLTESKIKPLNNEGFEQKFNIEYNEILAPQHFSIIQNGKAKSYEIGTDYVFRGFSGAGKVSGDVVFCGYGLSQPELGYDDYAGIDVSGKTVVCFKYNPRWTIKEKGFSNGNPREKAIVAAKHGASAILFVSFPNDAEPQKPIGSLIAGAGEQMINFPELHIDLKTAEDLFSGSSFSLKELQTLIDSLKAPKSITLVNKIDLEVNAKYDKEHSVSNVAALIEGNDEKLKNEYIIIGAHLDHVGGQAGAIYFPGANDNASGSSALLAVAKELALNKTKIQRSVIVVFFASEEPGLWGSKYFAEHLPVPKENVKVMINLDCVGYGDSIQVGGGKSSPKLWNIAKQIDSLKYHRMIDETGNGGGADAEYFFQKGIPTLYFVTKNSYKYLHRLEDKPETLNQPLFEALANLVYDVTVEIANEGAQK